MRYVVMQAVAELEKQGYDPEVVDLISLKPFDMKVRERERGGARVVFFFFFLGKEESVCVFGRERRKKKEGRTKEREKQKGEKKTKQ